MLNFSGLLLTCNAQVIVYNIHSRALTNRVIFDFFYRDVSPSLLPRVDVSGSDTPHIMELRRYIETVHYLCSGPAASRSSLSIFFWTPLLNGTAVPSNCLIN